MSEAGQPPGGSRDRPSDPITPPSEAQPSREDQRPPVVGARMAAGVVAGFVATAIVVMLTTGLAVYLMLEPGQGPTRDYMVVNLAASFIAAVAGGYVAGWIGHWEPVKTGIALGATFLALSVGDLVFRGPRPGQPTWYVYALMVLGPLGAVLGAWLRARRVVAVAATSG